MIKGIEYPLNPSTRTSLTETKKYFEAILKYMLGFKLRKFMEFFLKTPLHPQWLLSRDEHKELQYIAGILRGKILEIGSGNRRLEELLGTNKHYIGLDYPDSGRRYQGLPDVWGDAMHLPLQDNSIDCIAMLEVIEHLYDPQKALFEAARVIKNSGIMVITTPFLYPIHDAPFDFWRITNYQLKKISLDSGFIILSSQEKGEPLETSALLTALALTKTTIQAIEKRKFRAIILMPVLLAIPFFNMIAAMLSKFFSVPGFMPIKHILVLQKP